MNFSDLNLGSALQKALDEHGYTNATTIQHRVFPVVMGGRDVCGIAQTGTGKTFAYLLPLLRLWKFDKQKNPQILVMVPTRELVVQVVDAVNELCTYLSVVAIGLYGGVNINTQFKELQDGADIIVATPGRLYDLMLNGAFKTKAIKKLVIDEMDEMLNLGFRAQIKRVLDLLPERRQNLLFSATITPEVELLMNEYFSNPERVEAAPTGTPLENIEQQFYSVPNFNTKVNLLHLLITENEEMSKLLVFASTKKMADELFTKLDEKFPGTIGVIHSNKEQNHRFNTVTRFHEGSIRVLIATDIVARGIDISEVTHVINFDLPEVPENYIHRIGRTGRADKNGIAISFITEREQPLQEAIEALMRQRIPDVMLPEHLEISDVLIDDEIPKVFMPEIKLKVAKVDNAGEAFHEKSAKNKKVNVLIRAKIKANKKLGRQRKRKPKL